MFLGGLLAEIFAMKEAARLATECNKPTEVVVIYATAELQ